MKVSVIIPVYNGALFIREAYQQIVNQKLKEYEVIFIDNNSTDQSFSILKELEAKDPKIKVFSESIQGAAAARNRGLSEAKGAFVYFFDVDDLLFKGALNKLYNVLLNNPEIESVYGKTLKSKTRNIPGNALKQQPLSFKVHQAPKLGIKWLDYNLLPGTPAFMHRKIVFEKVGHFNTTLILGEDAALHVKLGMECNIAEIEEVVMVYYRHANSTVSTQNKLKKEKVFTYWQPLVKEHIPYLFKTNSKVYKKNILNKTYGYLPKMIALTPKLKDRFIILKKGLEEIKPLNFPIVLRPFLFLITLTGSINFYKLYLHFILKLYLKNRVN